MEDVGGDVGCKAHGSLVLYMFGGGRAHLNSNGIEYTGGKRAVVVMKKGKSYNQLLSFIRDKFPECGSNVELWFTIPLSPCTCMPLDSDDAVEAMFIGTHANVYVCYGDAGGIGIGRLLDIDCERNMRNEERSVGVLSGKRTAVNPELEPIVPPVVLVDSSPKPLLLESASHEMKLACGREKEVHHHKVERIEAGESERFCLRRDWGEERLQTGGSMDWDLPTEQRGCAKSDNYIMRMKVWKNAIVGVGQKFSSANDFRVAIFKYALANNFNYKFYRNESERLGLKCCADGCLFDLYACGGTGRTMIVIKRFQSQHNHCAGEECSGSYRSGFRLRASLLAQLLELKVMGLHDYLPNDVIKDIELELGLKLNYMQAWRCREFVRGMVNGKPRDQYKLLPWFCAAIVRGNPDSIAEVEVDGDKFSRMFISLDACVNGFKAAKRHILFVDACHLSGPYRGTMLAACGVDSDNHFINVAFAVVSAENYECWIWFLTKVKAILSGIQPVIMSDRHQGLIAGVSEVFGHEWHTYCLRHLCENFVKEVYKQGLRKHASKDLAVEMLMRVAYATNPKDYRDALDELRNYKSPLAEWVDANEPERWAVSLFPKDKWGWMNNNVAESFNKWMLPSRGLPIAWLLTTTVDNLSNKCQRHKDEAQKWANGVGPRIEEALKRRMSRMSSVCSVDRFDEDEFQVCLSNGTRLVVNLCKKQCTCREWQLTELPCPHAIKVISVYKRNLYDYVGECYKKSSQLVVYSKQIHPIETHDMPIVGPDGVVQGGDELDVGFHRCIMPPTVPRSPGRPQKRRIESQFHDKRLVRCSRCREVGHNRRSCKNNRADVDDDHPGDLATYAELFPGP